MVYPQHFQVEGYEGEILNLTNVIAAFNPQGYRPYYAFCSLGYPGHVRKKTIMLLNSFNPY